MAYNAVAQRDHDALSDEDSTSASPPLLQPLSHPFQPLQIDFGSSNLFMEHEQDSPSTGILSNAVQSIVSRGTKQSYEVLENDDFTQLSRGLSPIVSPESKVIVAKNSAKVGGRQQKGDQDTKASDKSKPVVRTASGRKIDLRHPTPDLQTLQGAYMSNVEHLEKTAEKLSMTSSIEDAIRQLHDEQKRADSRRSSLLPSPIDIPAVTRQFSNPNSILEINSAARSGGFSPGGFNMISPHHSFSNSNRGRSASKGSRFGSRPEPELEGRPLDSFVNHATTSPLVSRSASIAEEHEEPTTSTQPFKPVESTKQQLPNHPDKLSERPATSASNTTFEQAQKLFTDFDGEHYNPRSREVSETRQKTEERRVSSANRLSAMPQSYADPTTGQKMVYYPAPVPMMLNLPQKLSKAPSAITRDKRRTQVLSSLPPAARKSAIWLPDVLEDDQDNLAEDDPLQQEEYMPQHQRRSMGGRRSMLDLDNLPPQLRASTFFDAPGLNQAVEVKGESAVATLDSILDASAFAPVSAFTDHAFAGRLGAEVYGAAKKHRPASQMPGGNVPKRKSISNILQRRASSSDLLESTGNEQRRFTISGTLGKNKVRRSSGLEVDEGAEVSDDEELENDEDGLVGEEDEDEGEEEEDEAHPDDVVYHGAPTTLLAELQIRKQQQKLRTRPVATVYPNGMHSTLLELDAVAQVEKKTRRQRRVNLAWEDPNAAIDESDGDDDDVPLAMLFPHKSVAHQDRSRPMGLMERREMEDNEPLSQRRDRLQGKIRAPVRASTMIGTSVPFAEDENETLAQRVQRLRAQGGTATGLPATRPVSGDFTSELISHFGGEAMNAAKMDVKGKGKDDLAVNPSEEEETMGQRRKRLLKERADREKEVGAATVTAVITEERPPLKSRLSMADILQAHPAAGASRSSSYNLSKPSTGLLGLHEQQSMQRSSYMQQLPTQQPQNIGPTGGQYNSQPTVAIQPQYQNQMPGYGFIPGAYANNMASVYSKPNAMNMGPYAQQQIMMPMQYANAYGNVGYNGMGVGYQNPMAASMLQMQGLGQELNQAQIDMVERWRQSVMQ